MLTLVEDLVVFIVMSLSVIAHFISSVDNKEATNETVLSVLAMVLEFFILLILACKITYDISNLIYASV